MTTSWFQSAPPSRAATTQPIDIAQPAAVSIRAALTGGDATSAVAGLPLLSFNPRRPHGRRREIAAQIARTGEFQSAPPSRAATDAPVNLPYTEQVSIRAALTGGDSMTIISSQSLWRFQSAPPSRAATDRNIVSTGTQDVSIRAALTGGDDQLPSASANHRSFNPRRPHGRRREMPRASPPTRSFQSAPPSRAAT